MNWHNGLNWKKHLAQRERQREAYRQAGMTEAQIAAMEEFDDEVFRSDRRFYMHNISPQDELPEPMPEPAGDGAGGLPEGVRFGWEEEIGDPDLLELLKRQSPEVLRLVVLLVFEGCSQKEAARLLGLSPQRVSCRWLQFRRNALRFLEARAGKRPSGQEQRAEKDEASLRPVGQAGRCGQLGDQKAEALQRGVQLFGEAAGAVGPGAGAAADAALVAQEQE